MHGKNKEPGRVIWNLEADDVPAEFTKLEAAGATVIREPYGGGDDDPPGWIATLADPDGNYFQLMTPMPVPEPASARETVTTRPSRPRGASTST